MLSKYIWSQGNQNSSLFRNEIEGCCNDFFVILGQLCFLQYYHGSCGHNLGVDRVNNTWPK